MTIRLSRLFSPASWRGVSKSYSALRRARKQYVRGENEAALRSLEECLGRMSVVPFEYTAFHAGLLVLNHRYAEAARLYRHVLTATEGDSRQRSRYAAAVSRYYLSLIDEGSDALDRWREAKAQQPRRGVGWKYLGLPSTPVLH